MSVKERLAAIERRMQDMTPGSAKDDIQFLLNELSIAQYELGTLLVLNQSANALIEDLSDRLSETIFKVTHD